MKLLKVAIITLAGATFPVASATPQDVFGLTRAETAGRTVFVTKTKDGISLEMNYDAVVGAGIALSAVGAALEAGRNDKVDKQLEAILGGLGDIKKLLIDIIDILNNLGAVIDESNRTNTIEFIRTQLFGQMDILQTRLARFQTDKPYAKAEATRLLHGFELPAFQIKQYGVSPFNIDILAMLHLRALYKFEDEPKNKDVRRATWQQYLDFFKNQVLSPASPGSLVSLLARHEKDAAAAAQEASQFPPRVHFRDVQSGRCEYKIFFEYVGDLNTGYAGRRKDEARSCSEPREPGRGGGPLLNTTLAVTLSGDEGWEQALIGQINYRNGVRKKYLDANANIIALKPMIDLAKQAQRAAEEFVATP